jgi:hypothetical protein
LLVSNGGWLAIQGQQFAARNDFNPFKPHWWLLVEARSRSPQRRDAALSRLLQLLAEKKLDDSQIHSVVRLILAAQADASRNWQKEWGVIIEDLYDQQILSEEEWNMYWRQAWAMPLEVQPEVCKDDSLPVVLHFQNPPRDSRRYYDDPPFILSASIQELNIPLPPAAGRRDYRRNIQKDEVVLSFDDVVAQIKDGPQIVVVTTEVISPWMHQSKISPFTRKLNPIRIPVEARFTLHPPKRPTVVLTSNPQLQLPLLKSLEPRSIKVTRRKATAEQTATTSILVKDPPLDIAFTAYIRQHGVEWPIGRFACSKGGHEIFMLEGRADNLEEPEAVLILRPDIVAAASTIQIKEIWGEDIVIEKVPVSGGWVSPSPSPSSRPQRPQ